MGRRKHSPGFDRLWAPWRAAYFSRRPGRACIFCAAARSSQDRRHQVVARAGAAFVLLNRYPYNNGHLMIVPKRHVGSLDALTDAEWGDIRRLAVWSLRRLERVLRPQGFNLGINLGRAAGAGIPGHLHVHLVPRWVGDTNFFPVLGGAKVISQSLAELHRLLAERPRRGGRRR
jgi:ATP adenylyltransferase